jgi:hypothetical protein
LAAPRTAFYDAESREKPMTKPPIARPCIESRPNPLRPVPGVSAARAPFPVVPLLALAGTLLACAGCGRGPADKLEGKWVGDRIDNVSAEQVARATAWVKATTLEFAGTATVTVPSEPSREASKWPRSTATSCAFGASQRRPARDGRPSPARR